MTFCVISFNLNSLRARFHQIQALIEKHHPDLIALQEIKVSNEDFPHESLNELLKGAYHVVFEGQKSYHGVAIFSKVKPQRILKGFEEHETNSELLNTQKRLLEIDIKTPSFEFTFINGYFPQGEHRGHPEKFPFKTKFYESLTQRIERHQKNQKNLLVVGDMNIAPLDVDIGIGEDNAKRWLREGSCCFLPEERAWLQTLLEKGALFDAHRFLRPKEPDYTWFDYRSKGFDKEPKRGLRIDLALCSKAILEKAFEVLVDYEIRGMEKPSDHAPLILKLHS